MRNYQDEYIISKEKIDMSNMKKLREKKKYSQTKLQHLVGVTQQSITSYETGLRTPSLPVAFRLSEVLGCSIDFLVGRSNELEKFYTLSETNKQKVIKLIDDLTEKDK